jgi:PAS domain
LSLSLTLTFDWRKQRQAFPPRGTLRAVPRSACANAGGSVPDWGDPALKRKATQGDQPMKHPSIRDLLEYWNERRGRRAAPERDDIEPEAIRGLLADTFILSIDPLRGHPFRLDT